MVHSGSEYLPTAICETLDSVVSPEVRDRLLRAALRTGGLRELPATPGSFRQFLQGALHETLMGELGEELGGQVMAELGSIVSAAERDVVARTGSGLGHFRTTMPSARDTGQVGKNVSRDTSPHSLGQISEVLPSVRSIFETQPSERDRQPLSTDRAPHPPSSSAYPLGTASVLGVMGMASVEVGSGRGGLPVVLVASTDPALVRCFGAWLDPRADVEAAGNLFSIMQALEQAGSRRVVIVLDAKMPSVKPLSFAALAEELPPSVRVVLWGVGSETYAKMLTVSNSVSKWVVCSKDSTTQDIVAHCARIVG